MSEKAPRERLMALTVTASPDRLRLVRHAVRDAAELSGCGADCVDDIVIAVNEACMNVIQHGYAGDEGDIIVTIDREGDSLVIGLRDFSPAVDPAKLRSRDLDDIRPGGLGLHLIGEIMDDTGFVPPPSGKGNYLRMKKKIA